MLMSSASDDEIVGYAYARKLDRCPIAHVELMTVELDQPNIARVDFTKRPASVHRTATGVCRLIPARSAAAPTI